MEAYTQSRWVADSMDRPLRPAISDACTLSYVQISLSYVQTASIPLASCLLSLTRPAQRLHALAYRVLPRVATSAYVLIVIVVYLLWISRVACVHRRVIVARDCARDRETALSSLALRSARPLRKGDGSRDSRSALSCRASTASRICWVNCALRQCVIIGFRCWGRVVVSWYWFTRRIACGTVLRAADPRSIRLIDPSFQQ
jgi:hypothetical protein